MNNKDLMKPEKLTLSIIIVSWNTAEVTSDCIESVYSQTSKLDFEIIVIDNASSDNSVEIIKQRFPKVILIANEDNRGFGVANNQGMQIAKGSYVLLLNSDTIVLDNALEKTVAFAQKNIDAGVVGCRVLNKDRSLQASCLMFPSLLNKIIFASGMAKFFPSNKFWGRERMTWWNHDEIKDVDCISGCFMLVSKQALDDVGGFDELFFMYCEEVDWCWRFKKAGWKITFTPDAQIIHLGGISAAKIGSKRAGMVDKSNILFMFKHWPAWQAKLGVMCMALFYFSRVVTLFPIYLLGQKKAVFENHIYGLKGLLNYKLYVKGEK